MPRKPLTCHLCDLPMWSGPGSRPQGEAAHNRCRTAVGGLRSHGLSGYRGGCRCDICKAAQAGKMRAYMEAYRVKNGEAWSTTSRRAFRDANGYWPNARGSDWIHPKVRLELYERDRWTCYLCEMPVRRDGDPNGNLAPSLDHVTPKSMGGSDHPDNLKTAHRSCNSRKGVKYELV